MVKNKTIQQKATTKTPDDKFLSGMLWLYAISALFIIPVVYYSSIIDLTFLPKFLGITVLLLLSYVLFFFLPKYQLPDVGLFYRWAVLSWVLFILISILTLINAYNPTEGLADIFRIVLSLLFLITTASLLIKTKNLRPFVFSIALLAVVYLIVGYYQYFTFAFKQTDLNSLYKVVGIWAHKNVYDGVLYLMLPMIFYVILTSGKSKQLIFSLILFPILVLLFLLQTRSIWVALSLNILTCVILISVFRKSIWARPTGNLFFRGLYHIIISVVIAILVAVLITNYSVNYKINHARPVKHHSSVELKKNDNRAVSIFKPGVANTNQRIAIWKMTSKMIMDHPVMGVGAGNWKILIPDYFTPDYNAQYFNNWREPHNDFLWILAEKGFFGLLAYLSFFFFLLVYAVRLLKKEITAELKIFIVVCIAGLAGYCADASFSFPYERIEQQILMMFYAAGILWLYAEHFPLKKTIRQPSVRMVSFVAIIFLIVSFILAKIWIREEYYTKMAYTARMQGAWQDVIDIIDETSSSVNQLDPRNASILWFSGNAYLLQNKYEQAIEELEKAMLENPNSIMVLNDLGSAYAKTGKYQSSIEVLKKAIKIYPTYQDAIINLGLTYYLMGEYQKSLDCLYQCKTGVENPKLDQLIEEVLQKLRESLKH